MGKKNKQRYVPQWKKDDEIHKWAKSTGRKGYTGNRSRDTMVSAEDRQAYYKAQMNDYDTRRAMETFNLAKNDEEFRKSLGGKMRKFVDNYESKDKKEKDNNIVGISSYRELDTIRQFQKQYHKHKRNMGGSFSSANDYGGNTQDMLDSMRKHYDRDFLTQDDLPKPEETIAEDVNEGDGEVVLSPQHQEAQDRLNAYKDSIMTGELTDTIYGNTSDFSKPQNLADKSEDAVDEENNSSSIDVGAYATKARQASKNFLDDYKRQLTSDFVPEIY